MDSINYSEYNKVHLPRAEHLYCFIKNLNHAMQKTNDYEGAMHQLQCIGFSEEFVQEMATVASDYKTYHKQRIQAEQTSDLPEVKYPTIDKERVKQYAKNLQLIAMILDREGNDEILQNIEDAFVEECEDMQISNILNAYLARDVDEMIWAFTGYNLEELLAKAKVIPDKKELFYKTDDFPISEITFPFYDKHSLSIDEFKAYLFDIHGIHDNTWRLVQSIINFAKASCQNTEQQLNILWAVLKDYGIPEEIVRMVVL